MPNYDQVAHNRAKRAAVGQTGKSVAYATDDRTSTYGTDTEVDYVMSTLPGDVQKQIKAGIVDPVVQSFLARGKNLRVQVRKSKGGQNHEVAVSSWGGQVLWIVAVEQVWNHPLTYVNWALVPSSSIKRFSHMKYGLLLGTQHVK